MFCLTEHQLRTWFILLLFLSCQDLCTGQWALQHHRILDWKTPNNHILLHYHLDSQIFCRSQLSSRLTFITQSVLNFYTFILFLISLLLKLILACNFILGCFRSLCRCNHSDITATLLQTTIKGKLGQLDLLKSVYLTIQWLLLMTAGHLLVKLS